MTLRGQNKELLKIALIKAYHDIDDLEQFVDFKLEKNINALSGEKKTDKASYQLIKDAENNGYLNKLIDELAKDKPYNQYVNNFLVAIKYDFAAIDLEGDKNQENIRNSILNYNFKEKIKLIDDELISKFNIFYFNNYHAHEALFIANRYAKSAEFKLITLKLSATTGGIPPGSEFIKKDNLLVFIYISENFHEDKINDVVDYYKIINKLEHKSVLLFFISERNKAININSKVYQISDCNLIKELKTIEELKKEFVIWYNKENCGENIDEKTINCFCDSNINLKTSFNEKDKFSFNLLKNFALQHLKYEIDFDDNLNLKLNPC